MTTMPPDVPGLRAGLAELLAARLPSQAWPVSAFRATTRHLFAPRFAVLNPGGEFDHHDVHDPDPARRAAALRTAYSNSTLITRFDEAGNGISSSTEPSLMASMLVELDLRPGDRVLEIGTGTGYNAALLCEFTGSAAVTTVDVDPDLVDAAKTAFATAGYAPTVVCDDGAAGAPDRSPFDRIIATCGADRVPGAWLTQLTDDGAILVNLSKGIVLLRRGPDGTVSGRFSGAAGFMPLRSHDYRPRSGPRGVVDATSEPAETVRSASVPDRLDFATASFFTALVAEHSELVFLNEDDRVVSYRWIHVGSGSWARVDVGDQHATVHQTGPRRLWDEITPLLDSWHEDGRPGIDRYGITVRRDGTHLLWRDTPGAGSFVLPA